MSYRGYVTSRRFNSERVPQHVQNIVIREYCKKNHLKYLLSGVEYGMENSYQMFRQIVHEINQIDEIVAYTIFQFPKDNNLRRELFSQVIQKSKSIHFAVEHLILNDLSSFKKIEEIYFTANTYQDISNTKDIKNFVY